MCRLLKQILVGIINIVIYRKSKEESLRILCENMGIVYVKIGQLLYAQNINSKVDSELSKLCDSCNKIKYKHIKKIIEQEVGLDKFRKIEQKPIGSASVSQVHRAILLNGDRVAIKVKRTNVDKHINEDIKTIRFMVKYFSRLVGICNNKAGIKAVNIYLEWIKQEVNFNNEVKNIEKYREFTYHNLGKSTKSKIIVPKVYKELCTNNIIVMEYINYDTINNIENTQENIEKLRSGINNYLKDNLTLIIINNKTTMVFHGDPHEGNIFLSDAGNIGFLDMGLIFELQHDEVKQLKELFLHAYNKDFNSIYDILLKYTTMSDKSLQRFKDDLENFCKHISDKTATDYLMEMINICLNYNIVPPEYLFRVAKSFLCLKGINKKNK